MKIDWKFHFQYPKKRTPSDKIMAKVFLIGIYSMLFFFDAFLVFSKSYRMEFDFSLFLFVAGLVVVVFILVDYWKSIRQELKKWGMDI